jgi:predicted nucleic acid-binding protein
MQPQFLIDAGVLAQPLEPKPLASVEDRWRSLPDGLVATAAPAYAELKAAVGARKSRKLTAAFEALIQGKLAVLPFDEAAAETCLEMVRSFDCADGFRLTTEVQTAAIARSRQLILATLRPERYESLQGLALEDWSRD